jgi:hypothetical protein
MTSSGIEPEIFRFISWRFNYICRKKKRKGNEATKNLKERRKEGGK